MIYFWMWATIHWLLAALIMAIIVSASSQVVVQLLRTISVLVRGWPPNPSMDADGDIHLPGTA